MLKNEPQVFIDKVYNTRLQFTSESTSIFINRSRFENVTNGDAVIGTNMLSNPLVITECMFLSCSPSSYLVRSFNSNFQFQTICIDKFTSQYSVFRALGCNFSIENMVASRVDPGMNFIQCKTCESVKMNYWNISRTNSPNINYEEPLIHLEKSYVDSLSHMHLQQNISTYIFETNLQNDVGYFSDLVIIHHHELFDISGSIVVNNMVSISHEKVAFRGTGNLTLMNCIMNCDSFTFNAANVTFANFSYETNPEYTPLDMEIYKCTVPTKKSKLIFYLCIVIGAVIVIIAVAVFFVIRRRRQVKNDHTIVELGSSLGSRLVKTCSDSQDQ